MLIHSVITGVRPGLIIFIILQTIIATIIVARKDILTILFVGLPLSLTMAIDFACFAPMLPLLRNTRARHWIWQPWLQENLLALDKHEISDSVELDRLPVVRARINHGIDEVPSRQSEGDLERIPLAGTLRRPRSWGQLPDVEF